ncbi:MAG: tRNA glutamyl-Q(34) synthetase GluQRS [Deltaproteobacteria bacterium]|nr:tRNA glutamyl-Q(34) synthetase GluQRS [Deltaproteobacteria bacterium]MBK8237622.1 tRNA glutamyl-Q(34) synthetase GluQRS [Deltaproteobacteria bacterium]MBP7287537.1 tRNA glutamyl-Q(34) synthetase GluQRS [Nannocystaceae bacterium]
MTEAPGAGRYAPSPTGPQHLGNARTALLAWLSARASGARFVLRIEDLDPDRSQPRFEQLVIDDLRWLGLDWDEGPDVGGPHGPYRQSQRGDHYAAAIARLATYPCTCTRRELREIASAPHGVEPIYPGTCLRHGCDPTRPRSLRWRAPSGSASAHDRRLGELTQDVARDIGDFVLRRGDGAFAYALAVVVDDAAMAIDQVVRGEDLWPATPRQVWLQRALALPTPSHLHVPLLCGPDGTKLSKRHGAPDLQTLRAGGADPARVVAVLAASAGLVDDRRTAVQPQRLIADFDPARLQHGRHTLDPARLR